MNVNKLAFLDPLVFNTSAVIFILVNRGLKLFDLMLVAVVVEIVVVLI